MPMLTKNESKNKLVPYKKYFVSLLIMINSDRQFRETSGTFGMCRGILTPTEASILFNIRF